MTIFLLKRALRAIFTIWLVVTFVFFLLRAAGDPILHLLPEDIDPSVVQLYRERWGLDRPLSVQYGLYFISAMHGDFGVAFSDGRDALTVVLERIPKSLELGFASLLYALILGLPTGILAALYRNSMIDRGLMFISVMGYSLPTFFLGILLILFFSLYMRWLPSSGSSSWLHLVMPTITLGSWVAASLARFTRAAVLDVLSQPYMRVARAKGLPLARQVIRHALPNAAIPIITLLGFLIGHLMAGAVVVETVFGWPGLGRLTVTAVANRELAVVQTIVLTVSVSMIAINLVVDLLYGVIDPRIRSAST